VEGGGLSSRAPELGLSAEELRSLEPGLRAGIVPALLATIVRYEDALVELALGATATAVAPPASASHSPRPPAQEEFLPSPVARTLSEDDLRFANLVAVRRFGGEQAQPETGDLAALASRAGGATPYERAASLAAAALTEGAFARLEQPTALLVMCAQLALDGLQLLAPQGAVVGMVRELAGGEVGVDSVARWLEDRSVPDSSSA
jgi:hypothetical protein